MQEGHFADEKNGERGPWPGKWLEPELAASECCARQLCLLPLTTT